MRNPARTFARFLFGLALVVVAPDAGAAEAEPIKIGMSTSESGEFQDVTATQLRGLQMWADDINSRGALLGRRVKIIHHDDASRADRAAAVYERLITRDGVDLLVSPYSSTLTVTASQVAERHGVPMISVGSAPGLWKRGFKNLYGLYAPADRNMDPVLALGREKGLSTVAVAHQQAKFPEAVAAGVVEHAPEYGLKVVFSGSYAGVPGDLTGLARDMKAANPDVVIVGGYLEDGIAFMRAARAVGLRPKIMALSAGPALRQFGDELGYDKSNGVLATVQWVRDVRMPMSFDFAFRYRRRHGVYPSYDAAGAYAAGQVLEAAVRLAGTTDPEAVRHQLSTMKFRSILGHYRVDESGMQRGKTTYLVQWQKQYLSLVYPVELARYPLLYPFPE
ncbi:MAG: amino acid ABC transporter substrate-binding protein [Deltaproteobacteria bacterium]|nr:amino acid ABC transporter substrate-binding protein [Deltaproteobacteria bacterium]